MSIVYLIDIFACFSINHSQYVVYNCMFCPLPKRRRIPSLKGRWMLMVYHIPFQWLLHFEIESAPLHH